MANFIAEPNGEKAGGSPGQTYMRTSGPGAPTRPSAPFQPMTQRPIAGVRPVGRAQRIASVPPDLRQHTGQLTKIL